MNKFTELNLKDNLMTALKDIHFEEMTEVQSQVIPLVLEGESLIVQSQTGTGKTHAFMIPIVQQIDSNLNEVQAVVTAPSRELADQLYEVAVQLLTHDDDEIRIVKYIGGTDKQRQIERLKGGNQPHIVIGTPGRIFDLMAENALWVQTSRILVVDEADMTLDMGFLNTVDEIASRMPEDLQMMVFSATIPQNLQVFLNKYMVAPKLIVIDPKETISKTVDNYAIFARGRDPLSQVHELLTLGNPYLALVFCNTKEYADKVTAYLQNQGLKVAKIHGDISPRERKRIMRQIRQLDFQYVVATDLAARGIDIPGTSMVINMEIPQELEFFIHRVGRTGRNNLKGEAYTFVTPNDEEDIQQLEAKGIQFKYVDIKNNEIIEVKPRHERKTRERKGSDLEDPVIRGMIQRNKKQKVKPGHKKKLQKRIEEHKMSQKRRGRQSRRR